MLRLCQTGGSASYSTLSIGIAFDDAVSWCRAMIVTSRLNPRKPPVPKPTKFTGPAIVKASKPGRYRARTEPLPDPEADARVAAFFARMGIKSRPLG
jgi:hypothetical protein